MIKGLIVAVMMLALCLFATTGFTDTAKRGKIDGRKEFNEHCAVCHPNGGNTINAQKTLNKGALDANGVKSAKDIMAKMRNPGPGMTKFDKKTISDKEAKTIAEYILNTFK